MAVAVPSFTVAMTVTVWPDATPPRLSAVQLRAPLTTVSVVERVVVGVTVLALHGQLVAGDRVDRARLDHLGDVAVRAVRRGELAVQDAAASHAHAHAHPGVHALGDHALLEHHLLLDHSLLVRGLLVGRRAAQRDAGRRLGRGGDRHAAGRRDRDDGQERADAASARPRHGRRRAVRRAGASQAQAPGRVCCRRCCSARRRAGGGGVVHESSSWEVASSLRKWGRNLCRGCQQPWLRE